ncbi:MAG: substrate-binding domain-containing protein [Clostridium sp.]|uniref:substrate-binding domain-containing protein n=1 Tax=Clostridium sp. TaxID=1506 RepID=UPI0025C3992F|nr:substrate-binding domain-containing protein [Clostridium sp.]MCF0147454.1 substrate-binding domain-containing protein [Clostridium sp.]
MKIKKKMIVLILLIAVLASSLVLLKEGGKKENVVYDISVIIRGKNNEEWNIIKAGMEQASSEMNVNLRFISLLEENNVQEQRDYIENAIDSGADAIIISPSDYTALSDIIENSNKKVPIVLFESKIDTKQNIPYISSDNYELGKKLAEEVIRNGNTRKNIIIAKSNLEFSSLVDRYNGFKDEINKSKNTYEVIELPKDDSKLYNEVRNIMNEDKGRVLVAFEASELEAIGRAKKYIINNTDAKYDTEVYGIGRTSLIISLIEEKIINSTVIQNEFNIGYLSVNTAVNKIEKKKIDNKINIESTVINSENMYSKQNEKVLFPIVR